MKLNQREKNPHWLHRTIGEVPHGSILGIVCLAIFGCGPSETRYAEHVRISANTSALTSATAVRNAVGLLVSDVASIDFGTSDQAGLAVFDTAVGSFPTQGTSYFMMSSGDTASAFNANTSPSTSTVLGGLNHTGGEDLVQTVFRLFPPAGASCLAIDFSFFSEEFPEFVGSKYNDAFIIEVGQSTFQIVDNQVIAPNNFAFDTANNVISVNTVFGVTAGNATGTTYDGATGLLTAKTPIENPGSVLTVTLSIMDLGDSIYDSTAFIDNFRWLYGVACEPGADTDADRDSLLDSWERDGIDFDNNGTVDLDLPAMGADPNHKDVFIEIDYMVDPGGSGLAGHTHKPKLDALAQVIDAFTNAPVDNPDGTQGIHVHIDAGSDTIMNPVTLATWGAASRSDALAHQTNLGTCPSNYDWSAFDAIKGVGTAGNFSIQRADVFHYCIFAHSLCPAYTTTSGISRGLPASDFIVSLGGWAGDVGSVGQQAGTLLHELGHNLSFRHGGDDHKNYEPNYLSVMNYVFQTRGLRIGGLDGNYDYSRFVLPALDEQHLNEALGLAGVAEAANYGTRFYDPTGTLRVVDDVNVAVDWDWDGNATEIDVAVDLNRDGAFTVLAGTDNWDEIVFNGGAVGHLGENIVLPIVVPDPEQALVDIDKLVDSAIPVDFAVGTTGPATVYLAPAKSLVVVYGITNHGDQLESFAIMATSPEGWANLSTVPATTTLGAGETIMIGIRVTVPAGQPSGAAGSLTVTAESMKSPSILDSVTTSILVSLAAVDVKPGSNTNPINNNNGVVPVAVIGSPTFDVALVDTSSLMFGPGEARIANPAGYEDVNNDGIIDLVTQYRVQAARVGVASVSFACLWGSTVDGLKFGDCDPITHP